MARIDKTDSAVGIHRAPRAADYDPENDAAYGEVVGCGINASGQALPGDAGNSGFIGLVMQDRTTRRAGQILDIMTLGEIVEVEGLDAGTKYFVQADGTLGETETEVYAGHTVEEDRLVVRFQIGATA